MRIQYAAEYGNTEPGYETVVSRKKTHINEDPKKEVNRGDPIGQGASALMA
jgi:hypothetical protein